MKILLALLFTTSLVIANEQNHGNADNKIDTTTAGIKLLHRDNRFTTYRTGQHLDQIQNQESSNGLSTNISGATNSYIDQRHMNSTRLPNFPSTDTLTNGSLNLNTNQGQINSPLINGDYRINVNPELVNNSFLQTAITINNNHDETSRLIAVRNLTELENNSYEIANSIKNAYRLNPTENPWDHLALSGRCNRILALTIANKDLLEDALSEHYLPTTNYNILTQPIKHRIQNTLRSLKASSNYASLFEQEGHPFPSLDLLEENENFRNAFVQKCSELEHDHILNVGRNIGEDIINQNNRDEINDNENNENDTLLNPNDSSCPNNGKCYWQTQRDGETCGMFNCIGNGDAIEAGVGSDFQDIATRILLQGNTFTERGDDTFCDKCFEEAAENKDSYQQKKDEIKDKIDENLAKKLIKKSFYNLSDTFETIADTSAERNREDFNIGNCGEQLNALRNYNCRAGNSVENSVYQERLAHALSEMGIEANADLNAVGNLFLNKSIKTGANKCTRNDYALKKKLDWMSSNNKDVRDSFQLIMDDLLNTDEIHQEMAEYCENNSLFNILQGRTMSEYLANKVTARLIKEITNDTQLMQTLRGESDKDNAFEILCRNSSSSILKNLHCNDPNNQNQENYKYEFLSRILAPAELDDNINLANIATTSNLFRADVGMTGFTMGMTAAGIGIASFAASSNVRDLPVQLNNSDPLVKTYKNTIQRILDESQRYNPDIKANLTDRTSMCQSFAKSKEDGNKLSNILQEKFNGSVQQLNQRLCSESVGKIRHALCSKGEQRSYTPKDYKDALDEVRGQEEDILDNNLPFNSLTCHNNQDLMNTNETVSLVNLSQPQTLQGSDAERFDANPDFYNDSEENDFNTFLQHAPTCTENQIQSIKADLNVLTDDDTFIININEETIDQEKANRIARNKYKNRQRRDENNFIRQDVLPNIDKIRKSIDGDITVAKILNSDDKNIQNITSEYNRIREKFIDNREKFIKDESQNFMANNDRVREKSDMYSQEMTELFNKDPELFKEKSLAQKADQLLKENGFNTVNNDLLSETQTNSNSQNINVNQTNLGALNQTLGNQSQTGTTNLLSGLGNNGVNRAPANTDPLEDCDEACLSRLRERILNRESNEPRDNAGEALSAGLNQNGLSDSVLEQFTDMMKGNNNSDQLSSIQNSYQGLLEKTEEIEEMLEESPREVQEVVVPKAFDNNFVFNTRNSIQPEFYSREEIQPKAASFAPTYEIEQNPRRVSFMDYQRERRESNTNFNTVQRQMNTSIDQAFLTTTSSRILDDNYIDAYIDHVDQSNGSIDHLVVFEDGVPAKIRVPDPQNSGQYVLRTIPQSLREKILNQVENDEVESYSLYNMVNFEQSLSDFITTVEAENENIVSLGGLNQILNNIDQTQN